jgi:hypothetical protein
MYPKRIRDEALASAEVDKVFPIGKANATSFIYKSSVHAIGLYAAGEIKFLCPVELVTNITHEVYKAMLKPSVLITISYIDGDSLSHYSFKLYPRCEEIIRSTNKTDFCVMLIDTLFADIVSSIAKFEESLPSYRALANRAKLKNFSDFEELNSINLNSTKKYSSFLSGIREVAKKQNKKQLIKDIVLWIVIGTIILVALIFVLNAVVKF